MLELGDRYKEAILTFYEQNQRYPRKDEKNQLLSDLGCIGIGKILSSEYKCGRDIYKISTGFGDSNHQEAHFNLTKSSTICQYRFHKNKRGKFTINETKCFDLPCIEIGH